MTRNRRPFGKDLYDPDGPGVTVWTSLECRSGSTGRQKHGAVAQHVRSNAYRQASHPRAATDGYWEQPGDSSGSPAAQRLRSTRATLVGTKISIERPGVSFLVTVPAVVGAASAWNTQLSGEEPLRGTISTHRDTKSLK